MNIESTELQNTTETAIGYIPCYRLPFLSLYQIDVLEGLKNIPDKSQDLIIADPPYYKAINESWDKQWKAEADYLEWCKLWFNECVRVLKDTGSFYCYGNFDILSKQKVLIFDKQLNFRQNITLNKGLKSIAGRTSDKLRMFPTASEQLVFYTVQNGSGLNDINELIYLEIKQYFNNALKQTQYTYTQLDEYLKINGLLGKKSTMCQQYFGENKQLKVPVKSKYEALAEILPLNKTWEEIKHLEKTAK